MSAALDAERARQLAELQRWEREGMAARPERASEQRTDKTDPRRGRLSADDAPTAVGGSFRLPPAPPNLKDGPSIDPDRLWFERRVRAGTATFPDWSWARLGNALLAERIAPKFLRFIERYEPERGNAVLIGPTGSGKTTTVVAVKHRLIASVLLRGQTEGWGRAPAARLIRKSFFVRVAELARSVREHPLGADLAPEVRRAMAASWLVLDDLGNEPAGFEPYILEILDARYVCAGRVTWVTSGFEKPQLADRYGEASVRRLLEPKGFLVEAGSGR